MPISEQTRELVRRVVAGAVLASIVWVIAGFCNDWSRPWKLAEIHCQAIGHTSGWWDGKQIRCVDIQVREAK